MRKYIILFIIDASLKSDKPISISGVTLYTKADNLIAEIIVYEQSISEAEKKASDQVLLIVNALSKELNTNIKYLTKTIVDLTDEENIFKHSMNEMPSTITVRVPFSDEIYSNVKRNTELARRYKKINKVFQHINSQDYYTWVGLYRVFEIINSDKDIINEGWISKTKRDNFKRTANHPEASGIHSRHGVPKSDKEIAPSKPMQLSEAIRLIDDMVDKWLATFFIESNDRSR